MEPGTNRNYDRWEGFALKFFYLIILFVNFVFATAAVAFETNPIEIKGIKIGYDLKYFQKAYPEAACIDGMDDRLINKIPDTYLCQAEDTFVNYPASYNYLFSKGKLYQLMVDFHSDGYHLARTSLMKKYGDPSVNQNHGNGVEVIGWVNKESLEMLLLASKSEITTGNSTVAIMGIKAGVEIGGKMQKRAERDL